MSEIIAIENRCDVVKDKKSNAVLSSDITAFERHMANRRRQQELESKIQVLETQVKQFDAKLDQAIDLLLKLTK